MRSELRYLIGGDEGEVVVRKRTRACRELPSPSTRSRSLSQLELFMAWVELSDSESTCLRGRTQLFSCHFLLLLSLSLLTSCSCSYLVLDSRSLLEPRVVVLKSRSQEEGQRPEGRGITSSRLPSQPRVTKSQLKK